jgi:hypothetical protein
VGSVDDLIEFNSHIGGRIEIEQGVPRTVRYSNLVRQVRPAHCRFACAPRHLDEGSLDVRDLMMTAPASVVSDTDRRHG